jgi:EAL domain-containing protein (putative c-di-GMP-specific phosphodiesterase class I)
VLVRLQDDDGEVISPSAFRPTAERFNMMQEIDLWILEHAIHELAALNDAGEKVVFSINLSGQTLADERLRPTITRLLAESRIPPESLIFEVTETAAIACLESARQLISELKEMGCRFALDDFGSGFSSFSHLKHLPVDIIKIDGTFVQGMAKDPIDRAMVASMNDIAHSLGRVTIAEYVEDAEILRLLKECGVDYAQGFYTCPPLARLRDPGDLNSGTGSHFEQLGAID